MDRQRLFIVREDALPVGLIKVFEARALLRRGGVKTIGEAVAHVGVSRSAYYKYRNAIELCDRQSGERLMTIQAVLSDRVGVLSALLNALARSGCSVMTLNQSVPVAGAAGITLTVRAGGLKLSVERLSGRLLSLDGVSDLQIVPQGV